PRRQPLDRIERPGRAGRAHPSLCRARLPPPRVPCAGPGPGTLSQALRGTRAAALAQGIRLSVTTRVDIIGLAGVPMVQPGDNLGAIAIAALVEAELHPQHGDVLVVAQKIVSKAENRFVEVAGVVPTQQ